MSGPTNGDDLPLAGRAVLELIPAVGGFLEALLAWAWKEDIARLRRLEEDLLAACTEETLTRAFQDERRCQLLVDAARAVNLTAWEQKRVAMGVVVAAALNGDDAQLDDSELLVTALTDLDRHHFRLLARLRDLALTEEGSYSSTGRWEQLGIKAHDSVIAGLQRHGAIVDVGGDGGDAVGGGGTIFWVSDFGRDLLRLVEAGTI